MTVVRRASDHGKELNESPIPPKCLIQSFEYVAKEPFFEFYIKIRIFA